MKIRKNLKILIPIIFLLLLLGSCSALVPKTEDEENKEKLISKEENLEGSETFLETKEESEFSEDTEPNEESEGLEESLTETGSDQREEIQTEDIAILNQPKDLRVKIKAVGDIFMHNKQLDYASYVGGEDYDFNEHFDYIRDFLNDSDLTIGNNEFTVNPEFEIREYPMFNMPISIYPALSSAGFDVLTTANNHALDTYLDGVGTTIDYIKDYGMSPTGTQRPWEKEDLILERNGISIGILAYTQWLNGLEYLLETEDEWSMINHLDPYVIEEDIKRMKEKGVDFVIVYPHWGEEYQSYPSDYQIDLGRSMVDWGADLVLGSHPHVVQPMEEYFTEDGRQGLIIYSMGNFMCDQSLERNGDIRLEQGVIMEIDLSKKLANGAYVNTIEAYTAHPTWRGRTITDQGHHLVQPYLCRDYIEGGKHYGDLREDQQWMVEDAYYSTIETLNSL